MREEEGGQGPEPADQRPAGESPAPEATPPAPEHEVFWGYSELFLFVGLTVPSLLAGYGLVQTFLRIFRLHPVKAAEMVAQQFVAYIFAFLVLVVIFRAQYGRPFWRSLGWKRLNVPPLVAVAAGCLAALGVTAIANLMRIPETDNPLMQLMRDRFSMALVTIFGITAGPIAEELAFRGFLQPLLVKSFGVVRGILIASVPFGLLHFSEYGNSWRHVILISAAGAAFGWMRQATGSTKASSLMHAAYNALFFAALWASPKHS
jgi:membrane protease YdiL (CAAX protease family)